MTDRKKPTVALWITVALVAVLVGYPLVSGPAAACCAAHDQQHGRIFMPRDSCRPRVEIRDIPVNPMSLPFTVTTVNGDWLWIGKAWVKRRDVVPIEDSAAYYTEYIRINPGSAWAYLNRGIVRRFRGESDGALSDYTESIRLDPKSVVAYRRRGHVWETKKQYDKALQDYSDAIRLNPRSAGAFCDRGFVWEMKNEFEKALADYSEAIRVAPEVAIAHANWGIAWACKGDFKKAIQGLDEAIQLDPKDDFNYIVRSLVRALRNELDMALQDIEQAIRLNRNESFAYVVRGFVWEGMAKYDKALADYAEAIRVDPGEQSGYASQANLLATAPDHQYRDGKRAIEVATKACELTRWQDSYALRVLAAAYAEAGNDSEAAKWRAKARRLAAPDGGDPSSGIGIDLLKSGKWQRKGGQ